MLNIWLLGRKNYGLSTTKGIYDNTKLDHEKIICFSKIIFLCIEKQTVNSFSDIFLQKIEAENSTIFTRQQLIYSCMDVFIAGSESTSKFQEVIATNAHSKFNPPHPQFHTLGCTLYLSNDQPPKIAINPSVTNTYGPLPSELS